MREGCRLSSTMCNIYTDDVLKIRKTCKEPAIQLHLVCYLFSLLLLSAMITVQPVHIILKFSYSKPKLHLQGKRPVIWNTIVSNEFQKIANFEFGL